MTTAPYTPLTHAEFKDLFILANDLTGDLDAKLLIYKPTKLSAPALMVLDAVARTCSSRARPLTRASLARLVKVSPSSMSSLVARLIKADLLEEKPLDDRSWALQIKLKGRTLLAKASVDWEDCFERAKCDLSPLEWQQLFETIKKLNTAREKRRIEERAKYMRAP
ncbi:hypothetical protein [Stenotrophomonas muris]|uniref:MarR family winged helix-turn-helix transcriptional regulator n=1 Tax=Stenotrophomonas muris TaxID=2963283 RepID=UPI002E77EBC8|nr:hypothetical protein [Stenotrophomonas muris]